MLQFIIDNASHINVWFFNIPKSILATSESTNSTLSSQKCWVISITCCLKSILDVRDNSISDGKIFSANTLALIYLSNETLNFR